MKQHNFGIMNLPIISLHQPLWAHTVFQAIFLGRWATHCGIGVWAQQFEKSQFFFVTKWSFWHNELIHYFYYIKYGACAWSMVQEHRVRRRRTECGAGAQSMAQVHRVWRRRIDYGACSWTIAHAHRLWRMRKDFAWNEGNIRLRWRIRFLIEGEMYIFPWRREDVHLPFKFLKGRCTCSLHQGRMYISPRREDVHPPLAKGGCTCSPEGEMYILPAGRCTSPLERFEGRMYILPSPREHVHLPSGHGGGLPQIQWWIR